MEDFSSEESSSIFSWKIGLVPNSLFLAFKIRNTKNIGQIILKNNIVNLLTFSRMGCSMWGM